MRLKLFFNKAVIFGIVMVATLFASNSQWGKDDWQGIIEADGKGYYAYLPAAFIYNDLNFSFFDSIARKYPSRFYDYRANYNGKTANKYFAGTAIAMMPFFLGAHAHSKITGSLSDGYSKGYSIAISLAAIFYLFIGLLYLRKILRDLGAQDGIVSFILIAIVFGTNVLYYTVCEPAMSHIYSFALITMFIYYLRIFYTQPAFRYVFILAVLLGMFTLIRPVNILIVFIAPFLAGDKQTFLNGLLVLKKNFSGSLVALLLFMAIVSIQLLIYKIQTGSFWVDSYGAESFNFRDPHLLDFLFSYKKGLFVYTPLCFISLLGFFYLFRKNKFQFYSLIFFLIALIYVLSSWWNWWYGGSFGTRVLVEYYAIFALLLYFSYEFLKQRWARSIYSFLIVAAIIICQVQTYQYRYFAIHWEKMDKEHYWRAFMRIDLLGEKNPNKDLLK